MSIDKLITAFDHGLRTALAPSVASRAHPDIGLPEADLTPAEKKHTAALMRINHVGEVCAQALYQGQALTSKNPQVVQTMRHAAREETDHLAWCESRIQALGGRKSLLNPFWYTGSLALGSAAGLMGDKWNLGFLAETERQVGAHLQSHLDKLNPDDHKTRAVITQMQIDESHHAEEATRLGAAELPPPIKTCMKLASKVMTSVAYYI